MPQSFPYLVLSDGIDTVTFADGAGGLTNWPPVRGQWGPQIAGIRTDPMSGRGPYADVTEDLSCNIRDTTAAGCYTRLDTLARLLDKAERWWLRNEQIPPVVLKYVPQGSTLHTSPTTVLQAIVIGRAGNSEVNGTLLPANMNDAGFTFEIDNVRVSCLRRGAWTGLTETTSTSGGSSNSSVVLTRAWASTHPINSPVKVVIGGFNGTSTPTIKNGFLMVGSQSTDIKVIAPAGNLGQFTSVNDSANLAPFTQILRYTPTGTTAQTSTTFAIGSTLDGPVAVIAAVRNNSATTTFLVHANLISAGQTYSTPDVLIDTSTTQPRLVYLGTVSGQDLINNNFTVTASAASGSLDISHGWLVNLRDETVTVIGHDDISLSNAGSGNATLSFQFDPTADQNPLVQAIGSSANIIATYRGVMPLINSGANIYACWASTNGQYWRFTNTSNAAVSVTLTATRYRSYLTPQ